MIKQSYISAIEFKYEQWLLDANPYLHLYFIALQFIIICTSESANRNELFLLEAFKKKNNRISLGKILA